MKIKDKDNFTSPQKCNEIFAEILTPDTTIVVQDKLMEETTRRPVNNTVDSSKDNRYCLVVVDKYY